VKISQVTFVVAGGSGLPDHPSQLRPWPSVVSQTKRRTRRLFTRDSYVECTRFRFETKSAEIDTETITSNTAYEETSFMRHVFNTTDSLDDIDSFWLYITRCLNLLQFFNLLNYSWHGQHPSEQF